MSGAGKSGEILLVVAAALVGTDGRVLLQERPPGKPMAGLWEFPGGKVEIGETPEAALTRELKEELGIILQGPAATAFASAPLENKHLVLLLYICRHWAGNIEGLQGQAITWASIGEMRKLPMPPADAPLIDLLERSF